jgi:hypothetical protein
MLSRVDACEVEYWESERVSLLSRNVGEESLSSNCCEKESYVEKW